MTTCNTVKQLIDELSQFNPDARLEPALDIDGNRCTSCRIVRSQEGQSASLGEVKALENKVEKLKLAAQ